MASRDIIAAIVLLIFSGLYAWAAFHIPDRTIPNTPGPSFFPFVIITIVAVLSAALLLKGLAARRAEKGTGAKTPFDQLPALTLSAFVIYLALLPWAGFLVPSVAFFATLMWLYGSRRPVRILLWSVAVPTLLYVIFTEAFQILLPAGPFGF